MTPTTPRKFTATPVTAGLSSAAPAAGAPGAPVTSAAAASGPAVKKSKKPLVVMIGALAVVVIVAVVWIAWKIMNSAPPVLTAPTEQLGKYVLSEKFVKSGYENHRKYLDVLEQRHDNEEVEKLWRAGKLTDMQMAQLRDAAWMGKYMGRMEKYHARAPGQARKEYIASLVDKKTDADDEGDSKPKQPANGEAKVPKREKSWGKALVATWPADVQAQWKELHKEIKKEEERREKEERKGPTTKAAG
jgi:hypothetical protein